MIETRLQSAMLLQVCTGLTTRQPTPRPNGMRHMLVSNGRWQVGNATHGPGVEVLLAGSGVTSLRNGK